MEELICRDIMLMLTESLMTQVITYDNHWDTRLGQLIPVLMVKNTVRRYTLYWQVTLAETTLPSLRDF